MANEKQVQEKLTAEEQRTIVKALGVMAQQVERARSKEDVGSEIYDIRTKQIGEVRNLAMKIQNGVLS